MKTFFFFSSRRRHTRLPGDWSSDVCSSDLVVACERGRTAAHGQRLPHSGRRLLSKWRGTVPHRWAANARRSEERRVGKERGVGGAEENENEKRRKVIITHTRR